LEENRPICYNCYSTIEYLPPVKCIQCAKPQKKTGICTECKKTLPYFDRIYSIFIYKKPVDALLHYFKYQGYKNILHFFQPFIEEAALKLRQETVHEIIPVPMHRGKLKEREYNHSYLIAEIIAKMLKIPIRKRTYVKKEYPPQAKTTIKKKRKINVVNIFGIDTKPEKCVLIVDDVVTTTSTVNELSRILKNAGAERVFVFSLARTPN